MTKLTKKQLSAHERACRILEQDRLTLDDKWFVYENWHEGADNNVAASGAYFTPIFLAQDFGIDVCGPRVIDLCAVRLDDRAHLPTGIRRIGHGPGLAGEDFAADDRAGSPALGCVLFHVVRQRDEIVQIG